jgi:hypothetical protein
VKQGKHKGKERRVKMRYALLIDQRFLYCFVDKLPYGINWTDITNEKALTNLSVDCGVGDVIKDDDNKLLVRDGVTFRKFGDEIAYVIPFGGNVFPAKFLLRNFRMPDNASATAFPLGIAADKSHGVVDIADVFHLLIVGPTGRGKSTFLHSLIITILDRNMASDVNLWLIDCKETEFHVYDPLVHKKKKSIVRRIEYNEERSTLLLQDAVAEIDRRRKEFTRMGAASLDDYNEKANMPMPRIIIAIDEVARLMLCDEKIEKRKIKDWAEYLLIMLATQGRSFGVHVVIATQYVSKDILTAGILLNFESVVCFGVKNMWQSNLAINDYHMAVGLDKGIIVFKRAETGPRQYTKYKACLIEPSERRFMVQRIKENGPGGSLVNPNQTQRLINDAILLLKKCNTELGGEWSNRRVFDLDGVYGVISKTRVDEIATILTQHGILEKRGKAKNAPRVVSVAFRKNEEIIKHILGDTPVDEDEDITEDLEHITGENGNDEMGSISDNDGNNAGQEVIGNKPVEPDVIEGFVVGGESGGFDFGDVANAIAHLQQDIKNALRNVGDDVDEPPNVTTISTTAQLDTFHYEPYMHKRRDVRFQSIRKWRLSAKEASMKMLIEMKRTCDKTTVEAIAGEFVHLLRTEYRISGGSVTAPPRGGAGERGSKHFATEIAKEVAAQMGMPFFQGFKTRTHKRGHYPKAKSGVWGDIPPLELKDVPPVAPIILIDDVASSGTTIAESAALLQEFGPVFPLVWIAGETSLDT